LGDYSAAKRNQESLAAKSSASSTTASGRKGNHQITVKDQNTGFLVAAAEVLGEHAAADVADLDESLTPPPPDAPERVLKSCSGF
jgi:hypothetical protein